MLYLVQIGDQGSSPDTGSRATLRVTWTALFHPQTRKEAQRMKRIKWRRIVLIGIALLGLALLPLAVVLYFIVHSKGIPSLTWPAIDLGNLDPNVLLARLGIDLRNLDPNVLLSRLGIDLRNLDPDNLLSQLMDDEGRANQTGNQGGVSGGTGAAGGGATGTGLGNDSFSQGVKRWAKKNLPGWLYELIFE
jgi:hypothetical protein